MSNIDSIQIQNQDPNQPFYSLDTFYATLLSVQFKSHTEAISFCRDLCSSYGFTVKQEQSTHKSIYIYCSREGLPDSYRNPRSNPQRNRQSQRCECRWRIVIFENDYFIWEFRKSQNIDACVHNHSLLRPEDVKKEWPREVSEKIFELARERLPTSEIRQLIRDAYPDISWDDRRFYNRLSEERQKMKQRDTAMRVLRLINIASQLCMVNAGNEDLAHYTENKLLHLLEETSRFAHIDPSTLSNPLPTQQSHTEIDYQLKMAATKINENKGRLAVSIPDHTILTKVYGQTSIADIRRVIYQQQSSRKTRLREDNESMDTNARKLSRQIITEDEFNGYEYPLKPISRQPIMMYNSPYPNTMPVGYPNFNSIQTVVNENDSKKRYYSRLVMPPFLPPQDLLLPSQSQSTLFPYSQFNEEQQQQLYRKS